VSQPEIAKITKNPYLGGSRSFTVIDVDSNKKSLSLLLVMIAACIYLSAIVFTLQEIIAVT